MINAIRFGRSPPPTVLTSPLPLQVRRIYSRDLLSRQAIGFATAPDQNPKDDMDDSQNKTKETVDIMCDSFGEGYATRSEEEGFGGTYGGNQSFDEEADNKKSVTHGNQHEYDKSQGSEVKEKEKSRHQAQAN